MIQSNMNPPTRCIRVTVEAALGSALGRAEGVAPRRREKSGPPRAAAARLASRSACAHRGARLQAVMLEEGCCWDAGRRNAAGREVQPIALAQIQGPTR